MVNIKLLISLFIITALLTACASNIPTVQPTNTDDLSSLPPTISFTATNSTETLIHQVTPSPIYIPTYTPTPLLIIPPYSVKQVILEYTRSRAALGGSEDFFDNFFGGHSPRGVTKFVLYSDGQIILQKISTLIMTKILTETEMNELLYQLDVLGFHMISTNQMHDDTDFLYDFGGRFQEVAVTDGAYSCLSIRDTEICYYEPYTEFVMPQAKLLFQFIEDYIPNNATLYEPDRILLYVSQGQDLYDLFVEQPITSISWFTDLPSLEASKETYIYLEGEKAQEFFSLVGNTIKPMIFNENGKDYSVLFTIVLPHETISQP